MVPAAAAAAADDWPAFVHCTVNNKRLCCCDEDPHCVPGDPSPR
jgi:hypothetical protein